jgi:hypothetical protein
VRLVPEGEAGDEEPGRPVPERGIPVR